MHCSCQSLKWLSAQSGLAWLGSPRACEILSQILRLAEGEAQPLWGFVCLFGGLSFVLLFKIPMLEMIRGLGKVLPWGDSQKTACLLRGPGWRLG